LTGTAGSKQQNGNLAVFFGGTSALWEQWTGLAPGQDGSDEKAWNGSGGMLVRR
jgi:hypothetical protein